MSFLDKVDVIDAQVRPYINMLKSDLSDVIGMNYKP